MARRNASLVACSLACFVARCGAPARQEPGASSVPPGGRSRSPSRAEASGGAPWSRFHEVSSWPPIDERPLVAESHATGRFAAIVRVNPESREAYERLVRGGAVPDGTLVAQFHFDAKSGKPGPVYIMEKTAGAWRFRTASADGVLLDTAGAARAGEAEEAGEAGEAGGAATCERCHAEAVADHLFGPRRGNQP